MICPAHQLIDTFGEPNYQESEGQAAPIFCNNLFTNVCFGSRLCKNAIFWAGKLDMVTPGQAQARIHKRTIVVIVIAMIAATAPVIGGTYLFVSHRYLELGLKAKT
jgi:hypothetical protein